MSKREKAIWIIDILTIVFILIALQSIAVGFEEFFFSHPLKERILLSIQLCSVNGWSEILHDSLGAIVPWSKFLLFIANVYAVIRKAFDLSTEDISSKSRGLIVVNLLFIVLKWIEFDSWFTAYMWR